MGYWNTRGLRGSTFEEMVNLTNDAYRAKGLAIIQKVPTPITPVRLNKSTRAIEVAYFEKKSTVDYIGAVQGIPVAFDAKETTRKSLPLQNIHEHQIEFMRDFQRQDGVAFLLVRFAIADRVFLLPFDQLYSCWSRAQGGGRKSIPLSAFDEELVAHGKSGAMVHYLEPLSTYLQRGKRI
ncbi:MAG: Holliday junction resolvase RecU [Defluviitaleaceae bacterium]|nr:Holliday junction resolvase RecU [Defluviitaleaceae bacterium]